MTITLSPDTRFDAERVQIALLRPAPAWRRKLHMVAQMNSMLRTLALSGLWECYPHATGDEISYAEFYGGKSKPIIDEIDRGWRVTMALQMKSWIPSSTVKSSVG